MIALALLALAQSKSFADIATLQLASGLEPSAAAVGDLDGDGRREVVVAAHARGKPFVRQLSVWRASAAGVAFAPVETLALTADVVAWALGDVRAGGGDEIVLFNAGGAFSWRPSGPAEQRLERIAEGEFLWQLADPAAAFVWSDGVRDLDGDGLVDLVLPEPGGYRLVVQRRPRAEGAAWGLSSRLSVPEEQDDAGVWVSASAREGPNVRGKRADRELSLQLGGGEPGAGLLVQVNEDVPAPQWRDWDGDGDLDLLAQSAHHLHVWLQADGGRFEREPALSLALPVDADRDRRLDASYSAHAADIDGDRRADCVIFAGDRRSSDVRTQGLFFTAAAAKQGPALFGTDGRPSAVLVFAGFVSSPRLLDLDGDGLPELVLRSVRPDLIDQLRSATSESIDADLYVYRNRGGTFARQADLVWRHSIPLKRFQLTSEFCGDLSGDGVSELLVRDDPEHLRVLLVRVQAGGSQGAWSLFDRPLWELDVDPQAEVELVRASAGVRKPELLVIEPSQVLYVRFP